MGTMYRKIAAALLIVSFSSALGAETLLDCSRIEDATDRVACYDKLAGRVEEKLEETYEGTTEERVEARNDSIAEEVVGAKEPAPELLMLEIKKVQRDRNRRIIYLTTDGRAFRRSTGSTITFKAGDKCTMKSGVMGSVFLIREDGRKNKVKELATR